MQKINKYLVPLLVLLINTADGITIRSVASTDWTNTSTWSGGQVPVNPDTIVVEHYVTINSDLIISPPTVLFIENTGTICGDYLLNISCGSKWINHGSVFVNRFIVRNGTNYCTVTTKGTNTVTGCPSGMWSVLPPNGNVNIVPWTVCKAVDTNWEISAGVTGGCTVGIREFEEKGLFSIYPNPFNERLNFSSLSRIDGDISIRDISGREVVTEKIISSYEASVNVSALDPGVYFVEISKDNTRFIKKTIKN